MSKNEKPKIKFRDENISLFKARMRIAGLYIGMIKPEIFELNDEEFSDYIKWKYPKNDEKTINEYFIHVLNQGIKTAKIKYCMAHGGHIAKKGSEHIPLGSNVTNYQCKRDGISYEEKPKEKTFNSLEDNL